jgi:uncharacterized protein YcbK (DUF882 family)
VTRVHSTSRRGRTASFFALLPLSLSGLLSGSPPADASGPSFAIADAHETPAELTVRYVPAGRFPFTEAFAFLPEISLETVNDGRATVTRLYRPDGSFDEAALTALDEQLADKRRPGDPRHATIDRRLLALVFKAAWHFSATHVRVVSAYRDPAPPLGHREGFHGKGRALDFKLEGVKTPELASYLRAELARVGVGQYTHKRTQFVHLDVRETTFHWFDGSPPGRRGGIARIPTLGTQERDAGYTDRDDLPDVL